MNVTEVKDLFLDYIDESDETFENATKRRRQLERAYAEFRRMVCTQDPWFYTVNVNIAMTGGNTYDLSSGAVKILGNGVLTHPRLEMLIAVAIVDTSDNPTALLQGAKALDQLVPIYSTSMSSLYPGGYVYMLDRYILRLNLTYTGNLKLYYVPVSSVDWTKDAPADTEFIDDLNAFHDVIALLAVRHYDVKDGQANEPALRLLAERKAELQLYLGKGRDRSSSARAMLMV